MWTRREMAWALASVLPTVACGLGAQRTTREWRSATEPTTPDGPNRALDGVDGAARPSHAAGGTDRNPSLDTPSPADVLDVETVEPLTLQTRTSRGEIAPEESPEVRLAQRAAELGRSYSAKSWTVIEVSPFVVIGNGTPEEVERHASRTVRWAVKQLEKDYFDQPPTQVVTIWLLKDAETYDAQAMALFGEHPDTPYGWYSPSHHAMIMNIATGGGTLVHEIVHPYMAANFPRCPSWFNEGLASLFEQASMRDGHIIGMLNWRLPGLKKAIADQTLPSFKQLCSTGDHFYDRDPGTNYAQARYLCYWLQEHGKLRTFYRDFLAAQVKDPTGYETLAASTGMLMDRFEVHWRKWVSDLKRA